MDLKSLHILFVVPVLTGGGAERVVSVLSSGMAEQGYKISILVNRRCENEYPINDEVCIYSLPPNYQRTGNLFYKIKKTIKRYKILLEINPDIIIPFLHGSVEPTFLCNILLRKKFISTIRVNPRISDVDKLYIRDFIVRCSTACFVQNSAQKDYFTKKVQRKCFIVPNPVSDEFLAVNSHMNSNPKTIISAGRLKSQKNHALIIRAMRELHEEYPDISLIIYGEGPEKERLKCLVDKLGLNNTVYIAGRCKNMRAAYDNADIFILSSDFEGLPNALMEAMACGLPCISTDCPTGPKDLIKNYSNGILVPINDEVALANSIKLLLKDENLRYKIAENARLDMCQNYTVNIIIKRFCFELSRYVTL